MTRLAILTLYQSTTNGRTNIWTELL